MFVYLYQIQKQQTMYSSYMIADNGNVRGIEKGGSGILLSDQNC